MDDKLDYSSTCNGDDDDLTNPCLKCLHFCFPIGCMVHVYDEHNEQKEFRNAKKIFNISSNFILWK